jgi:hypothetical protein
MDNEQRKKIIRELDDLTYQAEALKKEFWHLSESLYQDKSPEGRSVYGLSQVVSQAVAKITEANNDLKKLGADWIKQCVIEWYRFHVEIEPNADDIPDPEIESVAFKGRRQSDDISDQWEIIYTCVTEGRQRMIAYSDGANDFQIYSSDPA